MAAGPVAESVERERALVQSARRGDARAFDELFRRNWSRLVASVRRWVRDPDLAQDVAQEAFIRAHRCLWRLEEGEQFGPWLRRIGRNIAVDRMRSVRTHPLDELTEPELIAERAPEPAAARTEHDESMRARARVLWPAIARLPPRDRRLLLLRFARGMAYREIARECSMTLAMTKIAIHRAKDKLHRLLVGADVRVA